MRNFVQASSPASFAIARAALPRIASGLTEARYLDLQERQL